MNRRHRPVRAGTARRQESRRLRAAQLAHDHPIRPRAQRPLSQLLHSDLTRTVAVGLPGLHRERQRMRLLQEQLKSLLQRANDLRRADLSQQRPQQRRLARPQRPAHQNVRRRRRPHRRPQKIRRPLRQRPALHQILQPDRTMPMTTHRQKRRPAHRHSREDPLPRTQPQIQQRRRLIKPPPRLAVSGGQMRNITNHLVLIGEHRLTHMLLPAPATAQHRIMRTEHINVLHITPAQKPLHRPRPQQRPQLIPQPVEILIGQHLAGVVQSDRLTGADHRRRQLAASVQGRLALVGHAQPTLLHLRQHHIPDLLAQRHVTRSPRVRSRRPAPPATAAPRR